MATANSYDINALYRKVFGVTGVRFAIPDSNPASNIARTVLASLEFKNGETLAGFADAVTNWLNAPGFFDTSQLQTVSPKQADVRSVLGTPIYEQIALTIPAQVSNGVITSQQQTYTLLDWPLFDITGQNVIQTTQMTNRKGSVKEFITEDDYAISIRGFIINYDSDEYPEQLVKSFRKIIDAKVALQITSPVFNEVLDIHSIVIKSWTFPGPEGIPNIQPFELECLSDTDEKLIRQTTKPSRSIQQGL